MLRKDQTLNYYAIIMQILTNNALVMHLLYIFTAFYDIEDSKLLSNDLKCQRSMQPLTDYRLTVVKTQSLD